MWWNKKPITLIEENKVLDVPDPELSKSDHPNIYWTGSMFFGFFLHPSLFRFHEVKSFSSLFLVNYLLGSRSTIYIYIYSSNSKDKCFFTSIKKLNF